MTPRLVPEILPLDAFCDVAGVVVVVGIGDFRSWIHISLHSNHKESLYCIISKMGLHLHRSERGIMGE